MARALGNQREHDEAELTVIEQASRLASAAAIAPMPAAPFFMRVPGIAVVAGSAAEMSAVMVVVPVFVMVVVSMMSVSHVASFDAV
jgi:hypothetical protein